MSGPKYSRAVLREIQRLERIVKQMEAELEKTKCTQLHSQIEKKHCEIKKMMGDEAIKGCEQILPKAKELMPESPLIGQIEKVLSEINQIGGLSYKCEEKSEKLTNLLAEIEDNAISLRNRIGLLKEIRTQIIEEGSKVFKEGKYDAFVSREWQDTERKVEIMPKDLQEAYYNILEAMAHDDHFEEKKADIDKSIMTADTDRAYKIRQLKMRRDAIIVEKNRSENNIEMLMLINEYKSLCRLLGKEAKDIPVDKDALRLSIKQSKEELENQFTQNYICKSVHKVFEDKGYDLIDDSVVSSKGGSKQCDLFSFGDSSMINVSVSNKGQMLFEVVGEKSSADVMLDSQKHYLESEMRRFCPNYQDIKKELDEKYGIVLTQETLCEADQKYARAVDVKGNNNRRRRKAEKKVMSYDG